ncbi:hypothetical protein FGH87_24515 [Salmonella enterica]|uniref:Phage protein n=3 Tax=Salmonella enterica TaxID=28901 RepID=A0A753SFJ6_SALER|nr:hypothetical protein [Salmonella enterica subsp. enterica serovar Koketime]EAB8210327.1 hypothetical protein [Salmonella enterica subsp. enterica serovar Lattenkamp]EAM8932923.1 hypothetical protein [Salmonella enterica]ECJ3924961.1 hypothetical protein [Salmonella enterica subsp. enterica]EHG3460588.1 hypothetical protein [Salmonella enterica subsp. enterica serovar Moero]
MAELNYEAIGRCKVLGESIRRLDIDRNKYIQELRAEVSRLSKGNSNATPPVIVIFDINLINTLSERVAIADSDLMSAVTEFNNWCQDAGEKPVVLKEPFRT